MFRPCFCSMEAVSLASRGATPLVFELLLLLQQVTALAALPGFRPAKGALLARLADLAVCITSAARSLDSHGPEPNAQHSSHDKSFHRSRMLPHRLGCQAAVPPSRYQTPFGNALAGETRFRAGGVSAGECAPAPPRKHPRRGEQSSPPHCVTKRSLVTR